MMENLSSKRSLGLKKVYLQLRKLVPTEQVPVPDKHIWKNYKWTSKTQKQLRFKQMRQGQAQSIKDWAMCDKLQEEMTKLRKEAFKLQEELKQYQTKERKAHWYKKKNKDKLLCNKESENRRRNEEKGTTSHSITIEELFQNSNSSPAETHHHNLDLEFEASPNKNLHSTELPDSENETVIIADNVSTKSPESDILLEKEATTTCTHDTCASEQTQNF